MRAGDLELFLSANMNILGTFMQMHNFNSAIDFGLMAQFQDKRFISISQQH